MTIMNVIHSHLKFKLMSLGSKKRKKQKEKERDMAGDTQEEGSILIFGPF